MHKRSVAKSMEIEQVIKQNLFQEEQRKEHIRSLQLQADNRQQQLSVERDRSIFEKKRHLLEKE